MVLLMSTKKDVFLLGSPTVRQTKSFYKYTLKLTEKQISMEDLSEPIARSYTRRNIDATDKKDYQRQYWKIWKEEHKQHVSNYIREWREAHREEINERARKRYQQLREARIQQGQVKRTHIKRNIDATDKNDYQRQYYRIRKLEALSQASKPS